MHMADALVAPAVAATMYVCSGGAAGFSVKKVRLESDPKRIPVMGVMGAFVFAAQMINFTIPGTGSSGHLCGGMMLTALLGPYSTMCVTRNGAIPWRCLTIIAISFLRRRKSWMAAACSATFSKTMTKRASSTGS